MKKTYAAPTLVTSGNVVHETLTGTEPPDLETPHKSVSAGAVGFYL